VCKADNLPPSCALVTKSGNLNFPEPSGPLRACNGTALPFFLLESLPSQLTRVEQISDTGKVNTNHLKRLILTFVTEVSSMSIATVRIHKQSRVQSHEFYRFKSLQSACFMFVSRITIIVGGECYLALERQIL